MQGKNLLRAAVFACFALACFGSSPDSFAQRTNVKPGMNSFSPQQDIQLGQKAAQEVEQKMAMCNDPKVDAYLSKIGHRLIEHLNTRGIDYPWQFHCVNDKSINAFALPGGYVFINRGAIEVAENEAQLAGVMAHELSHVALRHGTNQATKAQYAQLGAGIMGAAGGIFGGTAGAAAAGAGQFTFGSMLLHNSRGAETQADIMGTQVLDDSGYDPRAMVALFENLNASAEGGKAPPEFFSDHPNPDHRIERVETEIRKLGGAPEGAQKDSPEFETIKREVLALPAPVKAKPSAAAGPKSTTEGARSAPSTSIPRPEEPSPNTTQLRFSKSSMAYPANWKNYSKKNSMALIPQGGVVDSGNGQGALAWGMIGGVAQTNSSLRDGTDRLIEALQKENVSMEASGQPTQMTVDGRQAIATYLQNDSPIGGPEKDWLVTVNGPDGLYFYLFVAPRDDFPRYQTVFQDILDSVQFKR